jgi:hypothetical protein
MIIEDEWNNDNASAIEYEQIDETSYVQISHKHTPEFLEFIESHVNIRDDQTHSQLQSDLIKQMWQLHGQSQELLVLLYVSSCLVFFFVLLLLFFFKKNINYFVFDCFAFINCVILLEYWNGATFVRYSSKNAWKFNILSFIWVLTKI